MKFYDTLDKHKNEMINLFVDMDGVIAEYDIGNFDYGTIRPLQSNIKRIKELLKQDNISVKILTVCKNNNIVDEKKIWIKKYMPFFDLDNVIFLSKEDEKYSQKSSKELKSEYLKNMGDDKINILVDDDNEIVKYIVKNNEDILVFQVSSWID